MERKNQREHRRYRDDFARCKWRYRTSTALGGHPLFGAVVNIGIAYYGPHLASVAERLMDANVRSTFHGGDLAHPTSTLAVALRTIYIVGALVGVTMILLGRQSPAHPPTTDG